MAHRIVGMLAHSDDVVEDFAALVLELRAGREQVAKVGVLIDACACVCVDGEEKKE